VLCGKAPLTLHFGIDLGRGLARLHDDLGAIQGEPDRAPVPGYFLDASRNHVRQVVRELGGIVDDC
jgi:hypothetical protein